MSEESYMDEEPQDWAEDQYQNAKMWTYFAMSYLILISICYDSERIEEYFRQTETFLRALRREIGIHRFGEAGDLEVQRRLAENLNEIYKTAVLYAFREVLRAVEKDEEVWFFDEDIDEEYRARLIDVLHNMFEVDIELSVPDDLIDEFEKKMGIPKKSPWTLYDLLAVKLPEDFGTHKWDKKNGDLIIYFKDRHIASLKKEVLSKFPMRNNICEIWNEDWYTYAEVNAWTAMEYLILASICYDCFEEYIRTAETYLRVFGEDIGIRHFGEIGNIEMQRRLVENFDEIYETSVVEVLRDVAVAIESGKEWKFFDGEVDKDFRDKLLDVLNNVFRAEEEMEVPDDIIDEFEKKMGIPKKSPWTLDDLLAVKLPEDFGTHKWDKRNGGLIIYFKDRHIASLEKELLSKFPPLTE